MKTYIISSINGLLLVLLSLWGYYASIHPSPTAFIPVALGLAILLFNNGVRRQKKAALIWTIALTFLAFGGLFKPLTGAISRHDIGGQIRVMVMLTTSAVALIYLIKDRMRNKNYKKKE
ncbi:hypothetical protein ACT3CD_07115 [Geofilum sp. OHC36d9]|uniref:hypothetical protein n=1 Tax=Geofilum sp. OHC36d9 TaxID=3458413 RepID=UPI0040346A14